MLESQQAQLVTGLQELYKRTQNGQGWIGSPLKETSHGAPLTHDILERLGALKQDGHATGEIFEEDLTLMQQRLIANGAGFMQRETSSDSDSETAPSPMFEQMPQKPVFTDPFSLHSFPPTPPNQSPYPRNARTVSSKMQTYSQPRIDQTGMNPQLLRPFCKLWRLHAYLQPAPSSSRNHQPVASDEVSGRRVHKSQTTLITAFRGRTGTRFYLHSDTPKVLFIYKVA
jgi:hypothetical protein